MCVRGEEWLTDDKGALASFLLSDLPAAKKYSGCAEPSFATRKISSEPDTEAAASRPAVRTLSEDQQEAATQPDIQAPQHRSSFPATLDFTTIHQHRRSSGSAALPLYCLLPPPPPQPPSYTQSMGAKSQLHHSESPPEPPGYISSVVTQPPRAPWTPVSTGSSSLTRGHPNQVLRKIQSFTTSMSCGAASSIPGAMQIYSQKLSRPTSTSQRTALQQLAVLDQPFTMVKSFCIGIKNI